MLLVKTKIGISKIHGIGLYADQFIPKGTITWQYNPKFDVSFTEEDLKEIPPVSLKTFMSWLYFDEKQKKYVLCADNQRFINHSFNPNIQSTPDRDISMRDIEPGEELLCNYKDYEKDWFERRGYKEEDFSVI